ncbi:MAG: polyphosphate polymerase domain-containing protein [Phycisphaerales bacterium]|nr:polyphosphate polymerase domain-containing protein [Phycisphaerales bacterium]
MIKSRYEMKYLVTEAQAAMLVEYIRPHMRPDHHSPQGSYPLASLYLDSKDLRLYRESMDGLKNRFKLRIRCYSDDPDALCFFEIKRRMNQVIIKSRARVPRPAVAALLNKEVRLSEVSCDAHENLDQYFYYRRQINAEPLFSVRYSRQAFEGKNNDRVRITFDRNLRFRLPRVPEPGINGSGWVPWHERAVVFEIKFTEAYPAWIHHLVQQFTLQAQSVSKYARLITQAYAMHYGDPGQQLSKTPEVKAGFLMKWSRQAQQPDPREPGVPAFPNPRDVSAAGAWLAKAMVGERPALGRSIS